MSQSKAPASARRGTRSRERGQAVAGQALLARFTARVEETVPYGAYVTVGLSGGVDSVVLLDLFTRIRTHRGIDLHALHVHHGISRNADHWEVFCRQLAARRKVPLEVTRVDLAPYRDQGLEAAARSARYAAFAELPEGYLAIAHHADDQAETLLLQLLRGAGLAGLAGMPRLRALGYSASHGAHVQVLRPLLEVRRAEITSYARARRLRWIEDESNADTARLRNALRHEILPRLEHMNPAAVDSINRSARFIQDAAALLRDLAQADLEAVSAGAEVRLDALRALGEVRAINALRAFLDSHGLRSLSASQTRELWSQLVRGRPDANIEFRVQGHLVRRYRGRVRCEAALAPGRAAGGAGEHLEVSRWRWDGSNPWYLEALGGHIIFRAVQGAGIRSQLLDAGHRIEIRRRSDTVFKPVGARHRRMLKKLFQEADIPGWRRTGLPFLYIDEALTWVPGIGVGADFAAGAGEPGIEPGWYPESGP